MRHLRIVAGERVWQGEPGHERDGYLTLALLVPPDRCWHLAPFAAHPGGGSRAYLTVDDGRVFYAQIGGTE